MGAGFMTFGHCSFKARTEGSIRIGKGVRLQSSWRSNRVGLTGPVLLQTIGSGMIDIGDHSGGSSVVISSRSEVRIGKRVLLGGNARVYDHDFHALDPSARELPPDQEAKHIRTEPIHIGDDVFVGANAIILKGGQIGSGSVVAAGAVVFRGDYPANSMLIGNPAVVRGRGRRK